MKPTPEPSVRVEGARGLFHLYHPPAGVKQDWCWRWMRLHEHRAEVDTARTCGIGVRGRRGFQARPLRILRGPSAAHCWPVRGLLPKKRAAPT